MPESPTTADSARRTSPTAVTRVDAEAQDERAGEEARRIHRQHMPLDAERRVRDRMPAIDHRERRRGHHQVHQRVARNAARDRDDEFGWRAISRRRPAALGAAEMREARRAEEHQDDDAAR